ncbi:IclR family transcriptional regulator [Bacillus sp. APMAM]|nr:IclR family transcriptional regulator [Bacillus sp. APMAM]RTZ53771.1 IclR family transcriptional regulator [Bacillus sp. SAJ1]
MSLKTLENSLEILKYFTRDRSSWGVRELAKEIGISHSIVYRILSTFEQYGFLIQDPMSKRYKLGFRFLEYGQMVKEDMKLSQYIYPVMEALSNEVEESVFLTWLDKFDGVTVEIAESSQQIKYAVSLGTRTPLYVGASCKVIMAYLSKEQQLEIIHEGLQQFTNNTILDEEKLLSNLEEIKAKGWCYSVGEYSDAVFGLGIPLFNRQNEIIASLTIAGPEYRIEDIHLDNILKPLQDAGAKIQNYLYNFSGRYV